MANNQKIEWIDALKTIGILAVILGHIASPLSGFIFSWHMPLFFIIAGFFIKTNISFKESVVKDFQRLMIPYFIFVFIGLGADYLKRIALHREQLNYLDEIKGILLGMDMNSLIHHYGFVLWFLPALFFSRVVLAFIQKVSTNLAYNFLIVLAFFSLSFYIDLPFALDNAFNALLWVFIGFVFYRFYQESKILYILPLIGLGILILLGMPTLDMATKNYSNIVINIFWAVSIIYTLIAVLKKIEYSKNISKIVTIWGGNTMLLFIAHPYTNNIASIISDKIHGDWYLKLLLSLILLQILLFIKLKFEGRGLFKYV
ncbi:MAG: acyltransferase family protein [Sulfuricurvum sp.]|nr:acyltransferase family protein [Sulfuricurvum sp.]